MVYTTLRTVFCVFCTHGPRPQPERACSHCGRAGAAADFAVAGLGEGPPAPAPEVCLPASFLAAAPRQAASSQCESRRTGGARTTKHTREEAREKRRESERERDHEYRGHATQAAAHERKPAKQEPPQRAQHPAAHTLERNKKAHVPTYTYTRHNRPTTRKTPPLISHRQVWKS